MLGPIIMTALGAVFLIIAIIFMTGYNPLPFMLKMKDNKVDELMDMLEGGKEYDVIGLNKFMGRIIFLSFALMMFISAGMYAFFLEDIEWAWFEWVYVGAFLIIAGGLCVYAYKQIKSDRFIKTVKKEDNKNGSQHSTTI